MEHLPPTEDHSERFWCCLWELSRRQFKPALFRAARQVLVLTYGRGKPDLFVGNMDDLAELLGSESSNVYRVLAELVTKGVLGRDDRKKTWWFNSPDLWQVASDDQADPDRAGRVTAARARLLADNPFSPNQRELFPETTDAEVQAEVVQARGRRAASGLPRADFPDTPMGSFMGGETGVNFTPASVKSTVGSVKFTPASVNFTPVRPDIVARARGASEPGNQVQIIPGQPGGESSPGDQGEPGPKERRLHAESLRVFTELMEFCSEGGRRPCSFEQREQWAGRARYKPGLLERCLREVQVHIREERSSVPNRFGFVKMLWRQWEAPDAPPPATGARSGPSVQDRIEEQGKAVEQHERVEADRLAIEVQRLRESLARL